MKRTIRWVEKRHRKSCVAIRACNQSNPHWRHDSAWGTIDDAFALFKHGKNGHSGPWVVFRCNDTQCPAKIAIRLELLASLLPRW